MQTKWLMLTVLVIVLLIVLFGTSFKQTLPTFKPNDGIQQTNQILQRLRTQRNDISRRLNKNQQRLGQLECEARNGSTKTSDTGGWCHQASTEGGGNHMTDTHLVPALAEFLKGKIVASFGDGPGRYKQLLLDSGKVKGYDAYDGAPFCEQTSEGRVQFLDLTLPQYGLPMYDWVMSLEVAEHIPKTFESIYVDNVVRHASEGIILSWARLGQGGYSHVNNQPFEYVKKIMEDNGFVHNEIESKHLQTAASFDWLKWNTNVYRRKDVHTMTYDV